MKKTLILDSSQISTALECLEKWYISYKENLSKESEIDEPIMAGTFGHKWLEIFYTARGLGFSIQQAVDQAMDLKPTSEFNLSAEMIKLIRDRLNFYWMNYSNNDFIPLTKQIHSIRATADGLIKDIYEKIPLVEQGFSYHLYEDNEFLFVLEGKVDLICHFNNMTAFIDHKFQFRKRELYSKRIQFRNYALATGLNCGIANYIRLHKEVSRDTLSRQIVMFSPAELQSWRLELIKIFKRIAIAVEKGVFEHNWDSCEGKFGYVCQYHPICEESSPYVKEAVKKQLFQIKKEWKPW